MAQKKLHFSFDMKWKLKLNAEEEKRKIIDVGVRLLSHTELICSIQPDEVKEKTEKTYLSKMPDTKERMKE